MDSPHPKGCQGDGVMNANQRTNIQVEEPEEMDAAELMDECWNLQNIQFLFENLARGNSADLLLSEEYAYLIEFVNHYDNLSISVPDFGVKLADGTIFWRMLRNIDPKHFEEGSFAAQFIASEIGEILREQEFTRVFRACNNNHEKQQALQPFIPSIFMMLWRIRRLFLIKELYNLTIHHEELRLQHISLESLLAGMVQCRTSSVGDVNTFGFSTAYWNTNYAMLLRLLEQTIPGLFTDGIDIASVNKHFCHDGEMQYSAAWLESPRLLICLCMKALTVPGNETSSFMIRHVQRLSVNTCYSYDSDSTFLDSSHSPRRVLFQRVDDFAVDGDVVQDAPADNAPTRTRSASTAVDESDTASATEMKVDGRELDHIISIIKSKKIAVLRRLLKSASYRGIANDLDAYDVYTPLMWAAKLGLSPFIELLCELEIVRENINCVGGWNDNTALHIATERNRVDAVQCLINMGADINAKNKAGQTCLMLAVELRLDSIFDIFISCKDINYSMQDNDGYTALILASQYSNDRAIERLTQVDGTRGHIEITNKFGKGALFLCAENGNEVGLKIIHSAGANPDVLSKRGASPLVLTIFLQRRKTFEYLVKHGANLELLNAGSQTAMTQACGNKTCPIEMILELVTKHFEFLDRILGNSPSAAVRELKKDSKMFRTLKIAFVNICKSNRDDAVRIIQVIMAKIRESQLTVVLDDLLRYYDDEGNTCMMFACKLGKMELLETLWSCIREQYKTSQERLEEERLFQIRTTNKAGKTSLMLLADFFSSRNDKEMEDYVDLAAKWYHERPYLLDMLPKLLVRCKSPNAVMAKMKDTVAKQLKQPRGDQGDLHLLAGLVNICVALKRASAVHSIESYDLLGLKEEFEHALLELMNSNSMASPDNVTKVLRKRYEESDVVPMHVIRASTLCEGPLFQCIENDLTKILTTAHIKTFVVDVFYTSLKETATVPNRHILDLFRLRTGCTTCRFNPSVMFTLECTLMPTLSLTLVVICAIGRSQTQCSSNWHHVLPPVASIVCNHYNFIQSMLVLYTIGRLLYELGEVKYTVQKVQPSADMYYAQVVYKFVSDVFRHMISNHWNILDCITLCLLSAWIYSGFEYAGCLTVAVISLSLGLLRYLSLRPATGQLIIMIVAMVKDLTPFLYLLLVSLCGFAVAYQSLIAVHDDDFAGTGLDSNEPQSFLDTVLLFFDAAIGEHDFNEVKGDWVGRMIVIVYIVLMSLVLLNLVVARMSATHEKLDASAMEVWSRAQALNAEEFLLLNDRNPLCMLPPPLNIVAFLVWLFGDRLFRWHTSSDGSPQKKKTSKKKGAEKVTWLARFIEFLYSVAARLMGLVASMLYLCWYAVVTGKWLIARVFSKQTDLGLELQQHSVGHVSYAGTFSNFAICVITSPLHAVFEVFRAREHLVGRFQSSFRILSWVLFPVWVMVFNMMILYRSGEDTTNVTELWGGKVLFSKTLLLGSKPNYLGLCWCIEIAVVFVLKALALVSNCVTVSSDVGAFLTEVYRLSIFHISMTILFHLIMVSDADMDDKFSWIDKKFKLWYRTADEFYVNTVNFIWNHWKGVYITYIFSKENKDKPQLHKLLRIWVRPALYGLLYMCNYRFGFAAFNAFQGSVFWLLALFEGIPDMYIIRSVGLGPFLKWAFAWVSPVTLFNALFKLFPIWIQQLLKSLTSNLFWFEIVELGMAAVYVFFKYRECGDTDSMQACHVKEHGWTCLSGTAPKKPPQDLETLSKKMEQHVSAATDRVVLEIKVIRATLKTKGETMLGTFRSPFVVLKYKAPSSNADGSRDDIVSYTKTAQANSSAVIEFNETFYFTLNENEFEVEFAIYDRVGEYITYLCGTIVDVRMWIANRRHETPIIMHDGRTDELLPYDDIQIQAKAHFIKSTQPSDSSAALRFIPAPQSVPTPTATPIAASRPGKLTRGKGSVGGSISPGSSLQDLGGTSWGVVSRCSFSQDAGDEEGRKRDGIGKLFTEEDRDRIFDKLINKDDREVVLKVAKLQEDQTRLIQELRQDLAKLLAAQRQQQ